MTRRTAKTFPPVGDCAVCGWRRKSSRMCNACSLAYERFAHDEGTVMEAIVWAARRARRFTAERERLRARMASAGILAIPSRRIRKRTP